MNKKTHPIPSPPISRLASNCLTRNPDPSSPNLSLLHTLHKPQRRLPTHNINTTRLVRIANTITLLRHKHHFRPKRGTDKLSARLPALATLSTQLLQHLCHGRAILGVEVGVDFVKEVEGCGIALLDCEDQGERAERFLATGELLDALLLVVLAVEGDGDADARVVFDRRGALFLAVASGHLFVAFVVEAVAAAGLLVALALDDEHAAAGGHELDKDFGEGLGDLLEGPLNGFVFALVEDVDEVFDGFATCVKLFLPVGEVLSLFGEVFVLLEGFLVHVGILFEGFVHFAETLGGLG